MVSDAQTYGTSSIDELNRDGLRACVKRGAAYVRKRRADGDDRVGADDGGERGAERVRGNGRAARDRDGPARVGPPARLRLHHEEEGRRRGDAAVRDFHARGPEGVRRRGARVLREEAPVRAGVDVHRRDDRRPQRDRAPEARRARAPAPEPRRGHRGAEGRRAEEGEAGRGDLAGDRLQGARRRRRLVQRHRPPGAGTRRCHHRRRASDP